MKKEIQVSSFVFLITVRKRGCHYFFTFFALDFVLVFFFGFGSFFGLGGFGGLGSFLGFSGTGEYSNEKGNTNMRISSASNTNGLRAPKI